VLGTPTPDSRAALVERTRSLFKNGLSSGKQVSAASTRDGHETLTRVACYRLVAKLSEAELAERAGIVRETLARLARLRRRAQSETVEALAEALGVSVQSLTPRPKNCQPYYGRRTKPSRRSRP
jgi:DNA-binding XRE family transcriptional regulator